MFVEFEEKIDDDERAIRTHIFHATSLHLYSYEPIDEFGSNCQPGDLALKTKYFINRIPVEESEFLRVKETISNVVV